MNILKKTAPFQGLSGGVGWMKVFWLAFVSVAFAVSMVSCKNAGGKDSKLKHKPALTPETSEFDVTYDPDAGTFTFTGLDLSGVNDVAALKDGKDIIVTVEGTGEWAKRSGKWSEHWLMHNTGMPIPKITVLTATVQVQEAGGKDVLVLSFTQAKELVDALTYVGGEPTTLPDYASKSPPHKTEKFNTDTAQLKLEWNPNVSVVWDGEALGYFMRLFTGARWENPFDGGGDKAEFEASVKEFVGKFKK